MSKYAVPAALAATLIAVPLVIPGAARAAENDPVGNYAVQSILGEFTDGDGDVEPFEYDFGKIKVRRSKVVYKLDGPEDLFRLTLKLRLRADLENAERQTVKIDSGSLSIKETITGQSMGWGGDFSVAKYELWRNGDLWKIKHKRKLNVLDILGFDIFDDANIRNIRTKATRLAED